MEPVEPVLTDDSSSVTVPSIAPLSFDWSNETS